MTLTPLPGRPARRSRGLCLALLLLLLHGLTGVAMAHPGGDSAVDHLIVEGIGYLVAAFLAYLALSFARQVLYPRVRGLFD